MLAHFEIEAFGRSITGVFWPNYLELKALLDQASSDLRLAIELSQNVHEDSVRVSFVGAVSQRLHNYLASTMSLVDHARRLMRDQPETFNTMWSARVARLQTHGEVPFMMSLRVYAQHRALPPVSHYFSMTSAPSTGSNWTCEIELGTAELLKWDGWKADARAFLMAQGDAVNLRTVTATHSALVYEANVWLHDELVRRNVGPLAEANQLKTEMVAAQFGISVADASAYLKRITEEAQQPARKMPGL